MPRTADDIETILHGLNRQFEKQSDDLFLVSSGADRPFIAIRVESPIVLVRVDIGAVPAAAPAQNTLFRKLLEFNGADLAHASYALQGNEIVLQAGLELENLDNNELAAVLADIDLALARHVQILREIAQQ
jgi:hypothetical protein